MALTKIQPFGIDSTKVFAFAGVTLTGNVTATNANLGNIVVANYFSGDGSSLANVAALTAQTVTTAAQPNITSVGTLTSLAVTGDITGGNVVVANYFTGNGSLLTGLVATTAVTVTQAAQPNITSVGTLTSLTITGNISSGNASLGNLATASFFSGSGNLLSNIQGSNVTGPVAFATTANAVAGANVSGTVANATYSVTSGTALSVDGANVTGAVSLATFATTANAVAGANVSGTVANATYATTSGTSYSVDGANVSGAVGLATFATTANAVAGANVSGTVANATFATSAGSATTAGTVTTAAQPNITSLGTLTGLVVSGDATITGNLSISGSTIYANVTTLNVQDPIIEQGGGANGTSLSTNDGKDRGQLLHYYTTAPVDAFMGWDNSNAEFAFGSNVTTNNDVVTFNQLGNVRGSYFLGNGSALSSITGANVTGQVANALVSGTVTDAAQANITSVGTLTSLTVSGNIIAANAALGNLVTANFFSGDGSLLTGLSATNANTANTANTANSATTAGTVTTAAQPNITSVGTLTSLVVTGNISAGNISGGNVVVANYFLGDGGLLSNIASADNISSGNSNVRVVTSGNISMSVGGTTNVAVVTSTGVNINGYANITGNVTFGNLAVTAFANLGSVSGLTITGGNDGYVLQTNGTGGISWAPLGALVTVAEFTGNGVQTSYTLSTIPASEDYTLVNINGAQQLRSSYTVTGNSVTFSEAPPTSSSVEITTFAQRPTVAGYVLRKYIGNGSGTTYTVTAGTGETDVLVFLNGICQMPVEDYTISATTLTFSSPVANNVSIQIRELPR